MDHTDEVRQTRYADEHILVIVLTLFHKKIFFGDETVFLSV